MNSNIKQFLNASFFSPVYYIENAFRIKLTTQQKGFCDTFARFIIERLYRHSVKVGDIKIEDVPEDIKIYDTIKYAGISISSGRGCGKSSISALICLWLAHIHKDAKLLFIEPSEAQIKTIIIAELRQWVDKIDEQGNFVYPFRKLVSLNQEELRFSGNNSVISFKPVANNLSPDALRASLSGRHSKINIFILDEAVAFSQEAIDTLLLTCTDPVSFMCMFFNPICWSPATATVFDEKTSKSWHTSVWNYEQSELCNEDSLNRFREMYIDGSAEYCANIKGVYNTTSYEKCFNDIWIQTSIKNKEIDEDRVILSSGFDCAAEGDDVSVLAILNNYHIQEFIEIEGRDSKEKTYKLADIIIEQNIQYMGIDTIGPGLSVYEELKKICPNVYLNGLKNSRKALNEQKFINSRAESIWQLRELFERGVITIENFGDSRGQNNLSKFRKELSAFEYVKKNEKLAIIGKDKIRSKIGRSTDYTDAVLCAIYRNHLLRPENVKTRLVSPEQRKKLLRRTYDDYSTSNNSDWMVM